MPISGQAKRDYQRELMRKRREDARAASAAEKAAADAEREVLAREGAAIYGGMEREGDRVGRLLRIYSALDEAGRIRWGRALALGIQRLYPIEERSLRRAKKAIFEAEHEAYVKAAREAYARSVAVVSTWTPEQLEPYMDDARSRLPKRQMFLGRAKAAPAVLSIARELAAKRYAAEQGWNPKPPTTAAEERKRMDLRRYARALITFVVLTYTLGGKLKTPPPPKPKREGGLDTTPFRPLGGGVSLPYYFERFDYLLESPARIVPCGETDGRDVGFVATVPEGHAHVTVTEEFRVVVSDPPRAVPKLAWPRKADFPEVNRAETASDRIASDLSGELMDETLEGVAEDD
jgi:hypothetical protein